MSMTAPSQPAQSQEIIEIIGTIDRRIFHNTDNSYCVLSVKQKETTDLDEPTIAVGYLAEVREGDEYKLIGTWKQHPKYGRQFIIQQHEILLPSTQQGIIRYLANVAVGVGPATARKIVEALGGDEGLDRIKEDPDCLKQLPFLKEYQVDQILQDLTGNEVQAELTALICREGITPRLAAKVYQKFGAQSITKVKENPYILAEEMWGVGFMTADLVAQAVGIAQDSPFRIKAALDCILREAGNEGHCYLRPSDTLVQIRELLKMPIDVQVVASAAEELIESGKATREGNAIYASALYKAECQLAGRVRDFLGREPRLVDGLDTLITQTERQAGVEYASEQQQAIRQSLEFPISIVTGGPGVGKTTVIKAICDIYEGQNPGHKVYLASPTGRAAQRMTEAAGREAKTIHRLLRYNPHSGGFEYGYDAGLPGQGLVIIDEGCFHWKTRILLADGTSEYIGKIVNYKMPVKVMSYNSSTGQLEARKVVKWWKYERKGPLLEIDVSRNNSKRRKRLIRCTPKHLIATPKGYRQAGELKVGDRVLVRGRFLNDFQYQMVLGMLLGDGHLQGLGQHRNGSFQITLSHSETQIEYLEFKVGCFPGLFTSPVRPGPSGYGSNQIWYATMNVVDELDDLLSWAKTTHRIIPTPEYLNKMSPLAWTIWYLDDGSLVTNDAGSSYVSLHTERYDLDTQKMIAKHLETLLSSGADSVHVQPNKEHYFIRLNKKASECFLDMVEPYIPQCMSYKHRNPSEANFIPPFSSLVDAGAVPIRSIGSWDKKDGYSKHVYDIGVEGLHNYVAGNIVVHNSMCDVTLARDLFAALRPEKHQLVLVGDVDQLPSVGPGSVLRDLIACGLVPTTRLRYNYRQAGGSKIAQFANELAGGQAPPTTSSGDYEYISVNTDIEAAIEVIDTVKAVLAAGMSPMDFQVLAPMRKGKCGVTALNRVIRDMVNPYKPGEPQLGQFRIGDKVMVIRNNYDLGVFNGQIGCVTDVQKGHLTADIDGEEVQFAGEDIEILTLAYAATIHKAQGSEFHLVIMPLLRHHFIMLQRNLLYTGMTRAKNKLVLISDGFGIRKAAQNAKIEQRYSLLAERISRPNHTEGPQYD